MKLLRINHLGIAAPGLDEAMARMARLFDMTAEHTEEVAEQKVKTAFFPVGPSTLEYLESTDPEGPIGKFLAKRGPGIHHVCFEVDDIRRGIAAGQGRAHDRLGPAQRRPRLPRGLHPPRRDRWSACLLYTSPSPRDRQKSRMPSSA